MKACFLVVILFLSMNCFCDEWFEAYHLLRSECLEYARYCETNCQNEAADFLRSSRFETTHKFLRRDVRQIRNMYDGAIATNAEFFLEKKRGNCKLYRVVVHYDNGNKLDVNYIGSDVQLINRQIEDARYRMYQRMIGEGATSDMRCYDLEILTEGPKRILRYGLVRYYKEGKLIKEEKLGDVP